MYGVPVHPLVIGGYFGVATLILDNDCTSFYTIDFSAFFVFVLFALPRVSFAVSFIASVTDAVVYWALQYRNLAETFLFAT